MGICTQYDDCEIEKFLLCWQEMLTQAWNIENIPGNNPCVRKAVTPMAQEEHFAGRSGSGEDLRAP